MSEDSQLRVNVCDDLNFERNVVSRAELGEVMSLRLSHCFFSVVLTDQSINKTGMGSR